MPNQITLNGLETKTLTELVNDFTDGYQTIYGPDINLTQDTPDGQMMMIYIQSVIDTLDLVRQVYSSFDPDEAIGITLDQRVAINGIQRQAATYTVTPITVTVDRALNLYGLNQSVQPVFTVKDNAGNEFQLQDTKIFSADGSDILTFQAKNPGEVLTIPNTITLPVTIVLGVTSINNPSSYSILGVNEEKDPQLKIRRQKSVSLPSQGYLQGLYSALLNINGVDSVYIHENNTGSVDGDGTDSHTIWVIVSGSGSDEEIANTIYQKRNAGAGMRGDQTFDITQVDGSIFTVRWDDVEPIDLYIEFDAESLDGINAPLVAEIKDGLVEKFKPGVYEQVNVNDLATIVQEIDPNTLVTNAGFSLSGAGPFTTTLLPSSKRQQFVLDETNIDITVV